MSVKHGWQENLGGGEGVQVCGGAEELEHHVQAKEKSLGSLE